VPPSHLPSALRPIATWLLALGLGAFAVAQPILPPREVKYPPALSPAAALAALTVADGLQVELVAAEPDVLDPIDVAWGADGRMWVVEMGDYPLGADGNGRPGGRVRVLESTRGDGRYDRSTLFADGLPFPTSAVPWRDGVLVTAAPDILFLQDTDGDGRADRRTVLYTSLGLGNQQHLANGLQWGPDGWLHLANGGTRGRIQSVRTGESIEMGRDVRLHPDTGRAEPLTGRSQYGRNRDDWGHWFGNNNTNQLWHYALEDHYLRRNPHLVPPNPVVTVPESGGAARVFPRSETLARFNSPESFNHFTSACSPYVYRDDFLGAAFAGNVFVSENVHNLVHREVLTPRGATFTSRRAPGEERSEFLASTDHWARFTSTRAGPDGALYVVDMYRLVIEHPQYIPAEWMRELGAARLRAGADLGRIYRVVPRGKPLRPVPRLDRADPAGLVAALASPSGLVRDLAQQQLLWRGERAAAPTLARLLDHERPATRGQALGTLDLLGALTPAHVARGLRDPHPGVRRLAVRLSEAFAASAPELLDPIVALAADPDAFVRQQVAYTLGEWPAPAAGLALARLTGAAEDRFVVAAAFSSAVPHAATLIAHLDLDAGVDRSLFELAAAGESRALLLALARKLGAPETPARPAARFAAIGQLLDTLSRRRLAWAQLRAAGDGWPEALARLEEWRQAGRTAARAESTPVEERVAAVALLGRDPARATEDLAALAGLLQPQHPTALQLAAVRALGQLNSEAVPAHALRAWPGLGPQVRAALLDLLTKRPAWALALLDRLEADRTLLAQLAAAPRAALLNHSDRRIADRADRLFETALDPDRAAVIARYLREMAGTNGDVARGAEVFRQACAACHRFSDVPGGAVGPDLAGLADRSAPYLVTHILDPNRVVESRYVLYTAVRADGGAVAGIITGEAGNSLTLVGLDGVEQRVLRPELQKLESTGRSLMPDGLEAAITPAAMADLVAFLSGGNVILPRERPARKAR
jgi:putative membrane-bound dehydrogenase-like protein